MSTPDGPGPWHARSVNGTDHVLLTRFNLPSGGVEGLIRAQEGWLRHRVELFERYCVPSVANQTHRDLHWIVYLDNESPDWLLRRMEQWHAEGVLTPILRQSVSREELVADLRGVVGTPGDVLITSNLDNDDGLAVDFSERLVTVRTQHPRAAVYLTRGLVKSQDAVYLHTDRRNAFCSVRETWVSPVTAWSEYHNEFSRVMPTIELNGPPGWLQVVHGANVSNRVRGRMVSPRPHQEGFAHLVDVREPTPGELVRDTVLRAPVRVLRDRGRAVVRRAALRVLGKERYGQVRRMASTRRWTRR
jgi:hypothetical protein